MIYIYHSHIITFRLFLFSWLLNVISPAQTRIRNKHLGTMHSADIIFVENHPWITFSLLSVIVTIYVQIYTVCILDWLLNSKAWTVLLKSESDIPLTMNILSSVQQRTDETYNPCWYLNFPGPTWSPYKLQITTAAIQSVTITWHFQGG